MDGSTSNLVPVRKSPQSRHLIRRLITMTVAACVLAVIMTILFTWHAATYSPNQKASTHETVCRADDTTSSLSSCPLLPPILPLPNPRPMELENVFQNVEAMLKKMVDESSLLPSISTNIFYRDTIIWSGHHGSKRYKDSDAKPDNDTVYRIGSVTKIFPVLLMYKLYETGKIESMDDPLVKYAPEFSIKNPFSDENITLRQIASQMSGLPREAPCIYHCEGTNSAEQLASLKNRSLVLAPWTMPSYSNLGYALLGRLLTERLLNRTFEDWVQEEILDPLGMTHTGFEITTDVEKNMAFPYQKNGQRMPFSEIGWAVPAGGMYSTISDLAKLGMMFARPTKQSIFRSSSLREMSLPIDISPDGQTGWGSPFEMTLIKGFLVRGKRGHIDSYGAYFAFVPQLELGINVLVSASVSHADSNKIHSATEFGLEAFSILLPVLNKTLFGEQDRADFPINATAFIGSYRVNQTNTITLSKATYKATVTSSKGVLHFQSSAVGSFPFLIRYIGDPLTFQAQYNLGTTMSCFHKGAGIFADLFFEPALKDGLSYGFTLPQWSIVAVRIKND